MQPLLPAIQTEATTFGSLDAIEAMVGEASGDFSSLLVGAKVTQKLVMRELTRVLSESADLLMLLGNDLIDNAGQQLDDLLSLDNDSLMNAPPLVA
ncbi:MAG: hypothetical protein EBU30_06210 [Synechococcaceae bacterium WB6_3B_236]|nr:hypothetical protein [Synechococcaceae bacterium WB6_3B_236]